MAAYYVWLEVFREMALSTPKLKPIIDDILMA